MKTFGKTPRIRLSLIIPALILLIGMVFANVIAWQQQLKNQAELQVLFDEEAKNLVDSILSYIQTYKYGVLAARGVVVAHGNDSISRKAFKTYSASRNMDIEFPGARGFGFIRRVAQAQEADFLTQARADEMPDFVIKQFAPHNGDRYIIQYLEPAGRNRPAIGLDIASESSRRNAARQAMQTGDAILTPPITLVQASGLSLRSFVLLLPIYHLEMPLDTVAQREAATLGWSFAPIVIDEVLHRTGAATDKQIDLQITDVSSDEKMPAFYSSADFNDLTRISLTARFQRTIFGRIWEFKLHAQPAFYQNHEKLSPLWLASFITICSFLLAVVLYFYLKSQQQILAKSDKQMRLAAIVESAHDAIISLDLEGVVTSWNNAAYNIFNYTANEAIGKKIYDLTLPNDLLSQKEAFLDKLKRGEFIPRYDTTRKTRDGRLIDVSVMSSPLLDNDKRLIGTAKTIIDITEQKRSQELFRLVTEAVPEAIVTVNDDNLITLLNHNAVELFGYTKEELLGQNIHKLIPMRYREQHEAYTKQFHIDRKPRLLGVDNQNLFVLHKNGSEIPVEIQLNPFKSENENFTLASISDLRSHKKLQSELQTALARMKMAAKSMNLGIWEWQLENDKLIWDERMFEIYNAPKNLLETELYYDFWRSRVHPDDREYAEKKLLDSLSGDGIYNLNFRIVLANGLIRHIQAAGVIERNLQGKAIQMVGINYDITTRKANEQLLIESERRFRELFEYSPIAYQSLDIQGRFIDVNSRFCELLGYSREELLGKGFDEIWQEDTKAGFPLEFSKFKDNLKISNELYLQHKNGQLITVILEGRIQRDSEGQFICTHCILIDISVRKHAEQALLQLTQELEDKVQERTKELLTLYHQAPCGYHSLDINATIMRVNQTELDLLGYSREEYVGHQMIEFLTPDSVKLFQNNFPVFCRIGRARDLEFDFICKDGKVLPFLVNADLVRDAQGQPLYSTSTLVDNSERKTKEMQIAQLNTELVHRVEEAEAATRAKTNFLANMSHEIRTPMNAILGLAYLLQKKTLLPEERGMVEKIDLAGRSLLGIINTCLDFSKIESRQLSLEQIPFRLTDIFENLANIMCSAAGDKKLELLIAPVPKGADYLSGDAIRLGQVLINLASNAIKFTNSGEVVVNVQAVDYPLKNNEVRLRFSVRDTGIGIPAEKQELIFQAFSQADNSTSRLYGGTGLGLTISRHLVELMGGKLQLHSEIGVGSEFFFELTFVRTEAVNNSIPALPHQTVLIVDNHHTARSLLESTIQSLGWTAYVSDTSEKSLQIMAEKGSNYFDFLLINWQMPNANGVRTAVEIRTRLGKERCPLIIMMTAYDRMQLLEDSATDVADAILSKPITSSSLFNAVLDVKIKQGKAVFNISKPVDNKRLLGVNLLAVDDSETNRDVAYQILTGEGATVELAENGQEAVVRLLANPKFFHVVLMDVQMPVMDGYTATRVIRSTAELKDLPIIALTAGAFKSQRDAALEAGMNDFVGKPFDVDELIACVEKLAGSLRSAKTSPVIPPETIPSVPQMDFSTLPIINIVQGLKVWRDVEVYKKSLQRFLEQQETEHIKEALLNNHLESARTALHKFRGAAGALSLIRLMNILAQMENAVHNGENAQELIAQFVEISARTFDAVKAFVDSDIE